MDIIKRRSFLGHSIGGSMLLGGLADPSASSAQTTREAHSDLPSTFTPAAYHFPRDEWTPFSTSDYYMYADDLVIERGRAEKPHQGKVLAAIQAHSDDITIFAGGTVAKLIDEGYTGYLIRLSNDEASGSTLGHGVVQNDIDIHEAAKALGCKKAFSFYYRNHRMDDDAVIEIRARLIFLFRFLRVNTIVAMDPYDHYDENPDHIVVGKAAEGACWMSSGAKEYPEQFKAGLKPAEVREKYYFSRSPQGTHLVNRIVDITSSIDAKVRANMANKGKGPAGTSGSRLRRELAQNGRKLPALGDTDETANFDYVKEFLMSGWQRLGAQFGVGYAEAFRYIGPEVEFGRNIRRYASEHAVPL